MCFTKFEKEINKIGLHVEMMRNNSSIYLHHSSSGKSAFITVKDNNQSLTIERRNIRPQEERLLNLPQIKKYLADNGIKSGLQLRPGESNWFVIEYDCTSPMECLITAVKSILRTTDYAPLTKNNGADDHPVEDILNLTDDDNISQTEKHSLIASRIGQGVFREKLIEYWKGCSVTGCSNVNLLRASHISLRHMTRAHKLAISSGSAIYLK